jgi:pimeloyl-ACP methyl ester carboxylesterase
MIGVGIAGSGSDGSSCWDGHAGGPRGFAPTEPAATVRELAGCAGFDATLAATKHRRYRADRPMSAPDTVAFGTRDPVLPSRRSRRLDQLPSGTRVTRSPGCGHVPTRDDPAVAALIAASAGAREDGRASGHTVAG